MLLKRRSPLAWASACLQAACLAAQVLELEAYACRAELRVLWHNLMTELLLQRPDDPLAFMLQHLTAEKEARDRQASQS